MRWSHCKEASFGGYTKIMHEPLGDWSQGIINQSAGQSSGKKSRALQSCTIIIPTDLVSKHRSIILFVLTLTSERAAQLDLAPIPIGLVPNGQLTAPVWIPTARWPMPKKLSIHALFPSALQIQKCNNFIFTVVASLEDYGWGRRASQYSQLYILLVSWLLWLYSFLARIRDRN